ncbi:MAG: Trk family potassium uptake protein [Lachnospiraceae bacterium]|nr:Trk family potassium uptake protein [Lachnospiraceae bacterium]
MKERHKGEKMSSFRIIICGFLGVILVGSFLLMLPISSQSGQWTSFEHTLFTSTSAVCVTGLIVKDTATYWSYFGQAVILLLIQIGGLGVISVTVFIANVSGRKISLLQRSMLQDSISAHQIGGIVHMTSFVFKVAFLTELAGALVMLPWFCKEFGASGIWMAFFHSISAFCNAGFDLMGSRSGQFSSLSHFAAHPGIIIPICFLIVFGGIGFLTWEDMKLHGFRLKRYKMQSKAILVTSAVLIVLPAILFFFNDFTSYPMKERLCLALFQAVTPRTAGFNTTDFMTMTGTARTVIIVLMLIGGSPGSTAGGLKTTTVAVLFANMTSVVRKKKSAEMFGRRIEDGAVRTAGALLMMYLFLAIGGAGVISLLEGAPVTTCLFETTSAVGTVGLSLGMTPSLGLVSHIILMLMMFFGRVGGLTILFAAISTKGVEVSQYPVEKINVG